MWGRELLLTVFGLLLVNTLTEAILHSTRDKGSEKIFENHPKLAFLGNYNGKFWYIERTLAHYYEAVTGCSNMGMTIAKVNQAELNFLYTVTSDGDDYSWLGADLLSHPSSFIWLDGTSVSESGINNFRDGNFLGLVLDRLYGNSGVLAKLNTSRQYYICTYQSNDKTKKTYQPANELQFKQNVEQEGSLHLVNSTDNVPISSKIYENHPKLAFLGRYNNKNWYIERTKVDQRKATAGCADMGMQLAKVTQAELEFVASQTTASEDLPWLGGSVNMTLTSFRWRVDNTIPAGIPFRYVITEPGVGLVMARKTESIEYVVPGTLVLSTSYESYYICSL